MAKIVKVWEFSDSFRDTYMWATNTRLPEDANCVVLLDSGERLSANTTEIIELYANNHTFEFVYMN